MTRLRHPNLTLARTALFFTRLCGKLLAETQPFEMQIAGPLDRLPRAEALKQSFRPANLGDDLEPAWSTHWLKVSAQIPSAWRGKTVVLRFHSGSEALLWIEGVPFHDFNTESEPVFGDSGRAEAVLPASVVESGRLDCEIEIACNGLWGASTGMGSPSSTRYQLYEVQLASADSESASWFSNDSPHLVINTVEKPKTPTLLSSGSTNATEPAARPISAPPCLSPAPNRSTCSRKTRSLTQARRAAPSRSFSVPAKFSPSVSRDLMHFIFATALAMLFSTSLVFSSPRLVIEDKIVHPLPEEVFGQFLERPSWDGEFGPEAVCDDQGRLPGSVETALAGMHTPLVRFPFGTAGDYIDWQDLTDLPGRETRPLSTDHFGNKIANRFGLPEYFELAKRMGWKTILVANLRDALYNKKPLPDAAIHAAAMLEYGINHAAPGSIAAFQIGNEGWFFWPPKPEEREALGVADLDTAALRLREALIAYADAARRIAPAIPLICDAPRPDDGGGLENDAGRVWRMAVDHPDIRSRYTFLASHSYAPMGFWSVMRDGQPIEPSDLSEDDIWFGAVATLGRYDEAGQCTADAKAYDEIQKLGFRAAVTEWNWNGWDLQKRFPQAGFRDGVPAALGAAGFLHGLMRHPNVALATQSMMLGTKWGITSVRVLPDGSVIHGPQGEAVRLYAEHHGGRVLASRLEEVPVISKPAAFSSWWPQADRLALFDAVVTANEDRIHVHLINRSRTENLPLEIVLPPGRSPSGPARLTTLSGDAANVTTTGQGQMVRTSREVPASGTKLSVNLPSASISVLEIPLPTAAR